MWYHHSPNDTNANIDTESDLTVKLWQLVLFFSVYSSFDITVTVVFFVFLCSLHVMLCPPKVPLVKLRGNAFTSCNFFRKNDKNVTYDLSAHFVLRFLYPLLIIT